jgi:catechol 2,3-dioxygenase-like lactoylglutathione lyase family enzyme
VVALQLRGSVTLLQVFDMRRSVAFYRDLLGFEIVATSEAGEDYDWAWLRLGGAEVMLNTMYEKEDRPPAPDPARVAAHADTTLYFSCPDLDAAYAHLRTRGVDVEKPVVRGYGMKQLPVTDADGYGLCFQWPAA